MVTLVLYGLLALLLAGALFLLAAYLLPSGEQIAPPIRDEPGWDVPGEHRLTSTDIAKVRLPVALRGYRFAETDRLLDRLGEELDRRDAEIAKLRGEHDEADEQWRPSAYEESYEPGYEPSYESAYENDSGPERPDSDGARES